jgi:CheY-like chemotaxis protein
MIRSETPEPWPKMLLLTSPEGVDAVQMAGAGVWVSLTKPVSRSALFDGVVDCLAEKGGLKDVHQDAQLASQQRDEHLLVVEDNQVNQLVALGVLEALGYTADVAVDGIEAVRMAHEKHYDGILMDVQMPRMDGYAATREIRAQEPHGQRMAIIAMTAAAVEGERDKCLAAGMDDFLTKPLEPKLLEVSLDHWLATAAARDGRGPDRHDPPPVVLDTGRLATLTAMGPAASIVVDRAISNFINTAAAALDELRTAVEACDAGQLRMASHKLRGSALNLGADAVGQMCLELEQLGEAGDTTTAHPRLTSLQSALDEAADALRDYRDNRALR